MAPAGITPALLLVLLSLVGLSLQETNFFVGAGRADVTGPAAGVNMMGYANPGQTTAGIHTRLFSRAFIIADPKNSTRVIFVSVDSCMITTVVKTQVLLKLQKLYGKAYNAENVCISGIHTHSGPAGYHQYVLFEITSYGFIRQSLDALVDGIVLSIERAHKSIKPANIFFNEGELLSSNINRSPSAYLNNPADEKAKYRYNVDKNMTLLKFVDANGTPFAMISWFPVHCTSMNNTNSLISADNKGHASYLFEKEMNGGTFLPDGSDTFVAAFAQSNEGDVSPNTRGAHCQDTGLPCSMNHSTCNGKSEKCIATGPGKDMFESTKIIGENQYNKAKALFDAANLAISGPVGFVHQYVDMTNFSVPINKTYTAKTCKPAMGFSFAAGTTDGPGAFDFTQGDTTGNKFWQIVRNIIKKPSAAASACHDPKPILLSTGEMSWPYAWQPSIVETQLLLIGQFVVTAVPGEFTTMSGRRVRNAVLKSLVSKGFSPDTKTVIAGLSNTYSDYIATFEEYQIQRYEGASTIYGPHTLQAYVLQYSKLAEALATHRNISRGPSPPDLLSKQFELLPGVVFDSAPMGKSMGDVLEDANSHYTPGSEVSVVFVTGNPRNNLKQEHTFLTVEKQQTDGTFKVFYTDIDWCTLYKWKRTSVLLGHSTATIVWNIPADQAPGKYRITHYGDAKSLFQSPKSFQGQSRVFDVGSRRSLHRLWRKRNWTVGRNTYSMRR
ncbi:uncharacterized protein LOC135498445 [Lineus longissimus]|uniref:uncharacterized protein LOC135498445 n=1 Tax=Lineus longissimus TaxID=88925 RepID=UPI002B4E38C8